VFARLLLAAFLAASAFAQTSSSVFQQVDEMVTSLSEITGWKVFKKVPAKMLGKEAFRTYVEKRMKETSTPEQLRAEELTLKMFGFIPQDFDLAKETVDLVSEQAAAFYDYNKKRLFIVDSTAEGPEQRIALVHELAHALADQHHPLGKYLRKGSPDDDASTARQAVMEGQATWLTWAYVTKLNGGKAEVPSAMIDQLTKTTSSDSNEFPVFSKAPLYLRESLVFPYNEGLKFEDAVYHKLGRQGFDSVFERAPLSTQQILHPQTYFENTKPVDLKPPSQETLFGKQKRQFRGLAEGSLGELDFSLLLRQYVSEKEGVAAASHWRGGAFKLYENKRDKRPVLSFVSDWDSPGAARRFFELYQRVMKGKWKRFKIVSTESMGASSGVVGHGDSGKFRLSVSGVKVECVEGMPETWEFPIV
jgi:hypothetical protein